MLHTLLCSGGSFGNKVHINHQLYFQISSKINISSHEGWEYFQTIWNVMDVTVIVVSIATSAIGIYVHQFTQIQLKVVDS